MRLLILLLLCMASCSNPDNPQPPDSSVSLYFPPSNSNEWQTSSLNDLGWNTQKFTQLKTFLQDNNTRGFIILKDGKIVVEEYWGNNLLNTMPFNQNTLWYWASAGKTLTAFLTGKAQEEGFLTIEDKTSTYLGNGWTSMTLAQEQNIKIKHHLMMTTGLEYNVPNLNCTASSCLTYKAQPGTQWYYHNAPYTLLSSIIANATNKTFQNYTQEKLHQAIGMSGNWVNQTEGTVYYSNTRSAARFGLLMLAQGKWNNQVVMNETNYFNQMINTSQNLNLSYGYLWWLNGKQSIIYPGIATPIQFSLASNAPADMYAAMGKNGQFIDVVPSKNLVVVRFGESPDNALVPILFHNDMWQIISEMID